MAVPSRSSAEYGTRYEYLETHTLADVLRLGTAARRQKPTSHPVPWFTVSSAGEGNLRRGPGGGFDCAGAAIVRERQGRRGLQMKPARLLKFGIHSMASDSMISGMDLDSRSNIMQIRREFILVPNLPVSDQVRTGPFGEAQQDILHQVRPASLALLAGAVKG